MRKQREGKQKPTTQEREGQVTVALTERVQFDA